MPLRRYQSIGTLSNAQTVVLDHPLPLLSGRVRVVVEILPATPVNLTWLETLADIHQELEKSGHVPRDRATIDAHLAAERDSWDG